MSTFKCFASLVLAAIVVPLLSAKSQCPGNVASLPFRNANRDQIIVAVSVNHSGPYKFLLDTGSQVTIVDTSLAASLHLSAQGEAQVAGVGFHQPASIAQVELLEAGSHAVANQKVMVYSLQNLHSADLDIQGVLGEDFLAHFDVLIDNEHRLLCLDDSATLREAVKGIHIALADSAHGEDAAQSGLLIVEARLSDGMRPVRLVLDSGANAPFLYNAPQCMYNATLYIALHLLQHTKFRGSGLNGEPRSISDLPAQGLKIGSLRLSKVKFLTIDVAHNSARSGEFDGLLTLGLFRRVFIDHVDRFVVLEPRKEYEF